jgi:AcrR family transcriptional regulator
MTSKRPGAGGEKRATILAAALTLFGRYGFKRTSIDDIAREAAIAKGTVYLYFKGKEEIFRALSLQMMARILSETRAAASGSGTLTDKLLAALEAKFGYVFETVHRSAHALELLDSKNRLCADLFTDSDRQYLRVVTRIIIEAAARHEIDLSRLTIKPTDAAAILLDSAQGLGVNPVKPALYHRRLGDLVRIFVAGLAAPGVRSSRSSPRAASPLPGSIAASH